MPNHQLDAYDLIGDEAYLRSARAIADTIVADHVRNGLLVYEPGGRYYAAKLYAGEAAAGLVRLHLRLHPDLVEPEGCDWSW